MCMPRCLHVENVAHQKKKKKKKCVLERLGRDGRSWMGLAEMGTGGKVGVGWGVRIGFGCPPVMLCVSEF